MKLIYNIILLIAAIALLIYTGILAAGLISVMIDPTMYMLPKDLIKGGMFIILSTFVGINYLVLLIKTVKKGI